MAGDDALAAAIGDGFVYTAQLDLPAEEDIADYRDPLVDLLRRIAEA